MASPARPLLAYPTALGLAAAATLAAAALEPVIQTSGLALVFVLPVVIAAALFGWGPSLAAAGAGVLAFNFFLIEPRYTFRVADPANLAALVLLLAVAAIVSAVGGEARRRALEARRHADQALALQDLARRLTGAADPGAMAEAAAEALSRLFSAPAVVLLESGEQLALAAASGGAQLSPADLSAAGWALGARLPVRGGAYPAGEATFDFWPVASPGRQRAVLGLAISGAEASRPDHPEHQVEQVGAHLGLALDRAAYAAQALEHRVAMESQRLKGDLLAAVSHDLKTPLSTILFTLQSLQRFDGAHDPADRAELLAGAETEAQRLSRMVSGLLDMNRLDAGAVPVQLAPLAPADLAAVALDRAAAALSGRSVLVQVPADAPLLLADAALAETALANLLENAGKYAPAGSTVRLRLAGPGLIEVLDEGPGLGGEALRLLEPFVRGVEGDGRPPGMGLGLALARGFAEAQGGALELADRLEGGAVARLRLPLAEARVPA